MAVDGLNLRPILGQMTVDGLNLRPIQYSVYASINGSMEVKVGTILFIETCIKICVSLKNSCQLWLIWL